MVDGLQRSREGAILHYMGFHKFASGLNRYLTFEIWEHYALAPARRLIYPSVTINNEKYDFPARFGGIPMESKEAIFSEHSEKDYKNMGPLGNLGGQHHTAC